MGVEHGCVCGGVEALMQSEAWRTRALRQQTKVWVRFYCKRDLPRDVAFLSGNWKQPAVSLEVV